MLACIHSRKFGAAIVGAAIILGGTSVDCYSQRGSIHLTVVKAGFIVSTGSGTGTLDYQGRTYRLRVSSFGVGTIGVSGGELVGTAYNLRTAADISGTYKAAAAEAHRKIRPQGNMIKWKEQLNGDCPKRDAHSMLERCDLICPDLPNVL
jgi:hypothetical protein